MQTDLFGSAALTASQSSTTPRTDFLERHRFSLRLDQALVGFISLLVIYVMIFSFGVEKGKKFALAELRAERNKHEHALRELRSKIFSAHTQGSQVETTQLVLKGTIASVPVAAAVSPAKLVAPENQTVPESASASIQGKTPVSTRPAGKYTVQIVTYNTQSQVDKEFKRLKAAGLTPFSIKSGKYEQVCVNGFETREQANKALRELKTNDIVPADAYVRGLPSAQA